MLGALDHGLERAVRNEGVSGAQKQQGGQDARQPSVAVLKRMDREEHDGEHADRDKRVRVRVIESSVGPIHQFGHQPRRLGRRGSFEHGADRLAMSVESHDIVRR